MTHFEQEVELRLRCVELAGQASSARDIEHVAQKIYDFVTHPRDSAPEETSHAK
jgi:hypothetical protein